MRPHGAMPIELRRAYNQIGLIYSLKCLKELKPNSQKRKITRNGKMSSRCGKTKKTSVLRDECGKII